MRTKALAIALSLLAGAAFAQDSEAPAPQPGGDLVVGQELAPAVGQLYAREAHGDWQVRCFVAPEGQEDPCQLYQRMPGADGNPTADMNFFLPPEGAGVAGGGTLVAPLQTLLTAGVVISIDGAPPRRYPFSFCDQTGCFARMGFTEGEILGFKEGTSAQVILVPALAPDQQVVATMSLAGFTAGMAALAAPAAE